MEAQSVLLSVGSPAQESRPRPNQTNNSKLLKNIRSELWKEAQKAANSIREIPDDMEAVKSALREADCKHDREWKVVRTDFVAISSEVRDLAGRGYLQIRDVLNLRDFLSSEARFVEKRNEIGSSIELLEALKAKATDVVSRFTGSCTRIDGLASNCLRCTTCSRRIQSKVQDVKRKVQQLIELEIYLDRRVKAIVDQRAAGIVKILMDFVLPGTRKDILTSTGKIGASSAVSNSDSSGEKVRINVVDELLGVGRMLLEDFEDVQAQYNAHAERNDLATYARYFSFMLDLYECFENILTGFQGECIKAGSGNDACHVEPTQVVDIMKESYLGRFMIFLTNLF